MLGEKDRYLVNLNNPTTLHQRVQIVDEGLDCGLKSQPFDKAVFPSSDGAARDFCIAVWVEYRKVVSPGRSIRRDRGLLLSFDSH